jgi:hypothetical protein
MKNYRSITKKHEGKRILIKKAYASFEVPIEVGVFEISPSGLYVKLQFVRGDNTSYTAWHDYDEYEVLEILPSKMEGISKLVDDWEKKSTSPTSPPASYWDSHPHTVSSSDHYTVTDKDPKSFAMQSEIQKQQWVHGLCNPPADKPKTKASKLFGWGKHDKIEEFD